MKKILIVDDSPMVLNIIETALSLEDYEIVRASNADEALKKVELEKFDFGIFDVNMPGKTGIELIPLVLNHPNGKDMKIVILTTESSAEIRKKGEDAGASAWMVKPFKNAEMVELLKQLGED